MSDEMYYMAQRQDPSYCIFCATDMIRPFGWKNIEVDALLVRVKCGNCDAFYMVVMSLDQAEVWDSVLAKQCDVILRDAEALKLS